MDVIIKVTFEVFKKLFIPNCSEKPPIKVNNNMRARLCYEFINKFKLMYILLKGLLRILLKRT